MAILSLKTTVDARNRLLMEVVMTEVPYVLASLGVMIVLLIALSVSSSHRARRLRKRRDARSPGAYIGRVGPNRD
jgi:hypothetical protein